MNLSKEKSNNIVIMNFIMTCFMVFYHSGNCIQITSVNSIDEIVNAFFAHFFDSMGIIVMSYFFSVTGFLLFNNLTFKSYKRKIRSRFFSLFIPYILWQIIITVKLIFQGKYIFSVWGFISNNFLFLMWPSDGALWYVYAIFIMAILSPILLILFKNKKTAFCSVIIIFLILNARWMIKNQFLINIMEWGYIENILSYLPAFLMGAFYGKFHDEIKTENSLIYIVLLLFVSFCIEGILGQVMSSSLMLMLPLMMLFEMPAVPFLTDLKIYKLTFIMYAVHQSVISDVKKILSDIIYYLNIPAFLGNILIRLEILLLVIVLSALIYLVLNRIAPSFLKLLCGGRVGSSGSAALSEKNR